MQIKLSDYISIISILFAVVGGAFAFVQWHNSIKLKKSEYIYKLTEIIRTDKEIREIIQVFQYEVKWYDEKFHTSTFELSVDPYISISIIHQALPCRTKIFSLFLKSSEMCKVVARFGVLIYSHSKGNKQRNERRTKQCLKSFQE